MKKRFLGVFLSLILVFACFVAAACGKDETETPIGDPVTVTLGYAEDSGVLSWNAVEGATKYKIRLSNANDVAKSEETAETSLQLYLRKGLTRITLIAEDAQSRERGNGTKTVELAADFGAPEQVSNLSYNKDSGSLGWTAVSGATKYLVSVSSVNNESFTAVKNAEVTAPSYTVSLTKGIYDISVVAVNDHGAKSLESTCRYASYVDSAYGTEIADGVYKLFDFEDENVLDLSRYNESYKAWSAESRKPEWKVVNKHEKAEDSSEAENVDFDSNALVVRAGYNAAGDTVTRTSAVSFTLPQPLENWGRIYYDVFRTQNPSVGLLLTDTSGTRVLRSVEWDHQATLGKWGTVSFTKSEVLASNPDFGAIAEISFVLVNGKGGVAYFDNVRFDTVDLGYFGSCLYRRSTDTFTFDAVAGAQNYEMFVDGDETPIALTETEYKFETPLSAGNHEIKVAAYNGNSRREKTFSFAVGEKIKFNEAVTEGSDEYLLADFNTVEYREYLSVEGNHYNWGGVQTQYSISDGKLIIDPLSEFGYNRVLKYTFPTPIAKADMRNIKFTLTSTKAVRIYAFGVYDEATEKYEMTGTEWNGDWVMNDGGSMTTEGVIVYSGFKKLTSDYVTGIAVTCGSNVASTVVHLNEITYEKLEPITNFNTKIEGTENEYLLADFSVNGYKDYLSNNGSGKYTLSQNGLEVTGAYWNNDSVKYTLPAAIALSDIEQIKVEFIVTGGKHGVVRAGDGTNFKGTNTATSPMTFTIDTTVLTGDNLVSFLLSCNDTATTITYTRITYIKKAAAKAAE